MFDGYIGEEILQAGTKLRLKGLCFYDAGSRSFYTKDQPVERASDLSGLKIRVQESKTAIEMVRSLGGAPTPISWGELYTALQQGVVDGAENNPPSFFLSRHYEICKYYSLNEHVMVPDVLIIGTETWDALTEQEQQWLKAAAAKSSKHERVLWQAAEKEALEAVEKAGVTIIRPNKDSFIKATEDLKNAIEKPEVKALVTKIEQLQ